ncbi:membrane protein insertase YidC [Oceanicella actignis]|uniref:Membrane protein insertase YidC n=1 Tax=Oceanicella actignis TaxID=1189325 RepID=A0A1M7SNS5_9RHOB|nr:membrane protein insertase YidC [Oceanicella actignis]SES64939.1 protein translocase subunit yidC [Oceanicella actignis]SHN60167.1 YidC/Oxa1 family membrane protein insertase [Oceanicella actignis]
MDEQKNMLTAAVLSFAVIALWFILFPPEPPQPVPAEQPAVSAVGAGKAGAPAAGDAATAAGAPALMTREEALARSPRVPVRTPRLSGSIALRGARLDDLHLLDYRETIEPDSDTVTLLSPVGTEHPFFIVHGWLPVADAPGAAPIPTPGPNTEWRVESGDELGVDKPVTLVWDNGQGLTFRRKISVDENYMFTVEQTVTNAGERPVALAPYGYVARRGQPETVNFYILHEGGLGVFDGTLVELDYDELKELEGDGGPGVVQRKIPVERNGWLGFTDKYWMATLAPPHDEGFEAVFRYRRGARGEIDQEYRAESILPVVTVAPGATASASTRAFAGAKEYATIREYERQGIERFTDAIDWGWFFFLTKPILQLLLFIKGLVGNMGVAIILLTLIVKAALFPLAYKSYVAMSKMKMLQPEIEKIKERCGDDKVKLQQEIMALYRKEKANPAAGCLPILLQIPIFFSLYKVLFVTIEMRHAPFFGWIRDLSAPDPSSILNLFGLLPWDAPGHDSLLGIFSIGVLPILLGISMWLQQKLNPEPADPTQKMIFAWMPWIFMFMLGQFASGLVLYWIANNMITFIQQYVIMRSQGVEVDVLGNVKRSFKRRKRG